MKGLTVESFFKDRMEEFRLELLTEKLDSPIPVTVSEVNRPGLLLAGFTQNFLSERIQILGETEMLYLSTLGPEEERLALERLFREDVPCVIVAKKLPVPQELVDLANARTIPVLRKSMSTTPFIHRLTAYLNTVFAPRTETGSTALARILETAPDELGIRHVRFELFYQYRFRTMEAGERTLALPAFRKRFTRRVEPDEGRAAEEGPDTP